MPNLGDCDILSRRHATTFAESSDAQERTERPVDANRPGHAVRADVPLLLGRRRCWPRSCRRTSARRCGSSCSRERLLAFRDTDGKYGLIDEFCAHRGVSLWFGRNEEHGLRCPYHGWKYDTTGQCIDVPSEPMESGFCKKIKLKSYPLVKIGPVLWTYMGPPDKQPPLPEWEFSLVPDEQSLHLQAAAGVELAAGDGRRHRFQPRLVPASRRPRLRSAVQGRQGQPVQPLRHAAAFRGGGAAGRALHRRAPQCRERQLLLAHHAVGDAELHDDPAARRPSDARPLLGADRRPQLLGLDLRLPSDPRADQGRARRDGSRPGPALQIRAGQLSSARQQGQRLPDGPRRPARRQDLQRHRGFRDPGFVAAGEHGPGLRPDQGEPGLDRQRHHHGAPPHAARRQGVSRTRARCRPASTPSITRSARCRSCCRRTRRSRTAPRKRSPARRWAWRRRRSNDRRSSKALETDRC